MDGRAHVSTHHERLVGRSDRWPPQSASCLAVVRVLLDLRITAREESCVSRTLVLGSSDALDSVPLLLLLCCSNRWVCLQPVQHCQRHLHQHHPRQLPVRVQAGLLWGREGLRR
jgi:hypothetical protein